MLSIPDGWDLGLFEPEKWAVAPDGSLYQYIGRPIGLRVRAQKGIVLHANNGDESDRSWQILPLSQAPEELQLDVEQADKYKA